MSKSFKAPYRVGGENKTLTSKFVAKNVSLITDMMWQGLKFTIEEIRSDAPYGDGSPTNKLLRQQWLTSRLCDSFKVFYQMVGHCEKDAVKLADNAIDIIKSSAERTISEINIELIVKNWYLADTVLKEQKTK